MDEANSIHDNPSVIIGNSIKYKDISFIQDNNNWHYKITNEEKLLIALAKLSKIKNEISF